MSSLPLNTSSISNAYREGGSAMQRNASTIGEESMLLMKIGLKKSNTFVILIVQGKGT